MLLKCLFTFGWAFTADLLPMPRRDRNKLLSWLFDNPPVNTDRRAVQLHCMRNYPLDYD